MAEKVGVRIVLREQDYSRENSVLVLMKETIWRYRPSQIVGGFDVSKQYCSDDHPLIDGIGEDAHCHIEMTAEVRSDG